MFNVNTVIIERRRSQVVRVAWLWCRKSLEGRKFKAGLCHPMTGKLDDWKTLSTQL